MLSDNFGAYSVIQPSSFLQCVSGSYFSNTPQGPTVSCSTSYLEEYSMHISAGIYNARAPSQQFVGGAYQPIKSQMIVFRIRVPQSTVMWVNKTKKNKTRNFDLPVLYSLKDQLSLIGCWCATGGAEADSLITWYATAQDLEWPDRGSGIVKPNCVVVCGYVMVPLLKSVEK